MPEIRACNIPGVFRTGAIRQLDVVVTAVTCYITVEMCVVIKRLRGFIEITKLKKSERKK